jgi:hypothetical protein
MNVEEKMIIIKSWELLLGAFQFTGVSSRNRVKTTEAHSSFDVINVRYNTKGVKGRDEKRYSPYKTQQLDTLTKYIVNVIMELQFKINKHSQVFKSRYQHH